MTTKRQRVKRESSEDFLEELIEERTRLDPEFPKLLEEAKARHQAASRMEMFGPGCCKFPGGINCMMNCWKSIEECQD